MFATPMSTDLSCPPRLRLVYILRILSKVGSSLRELKVDTLACQTLVDFGVGVETVVDTATLLLIENDLEDLATILLGAQPLSDNLDGVDEISEDGVVHGGQSTRAWALLGLRSATAVAALGAGQNTARCNDDDVTVRELLLEFTGEAGGVLVRAGHQKRRTNLPLLGPVPALEERDGDKDDNSLSSMADFDL